MMGLALKESHRSWGSPIGVNTQHTSSVSSSSRRRWVLEVLFGNAGCMQAVGWRDGGHLLKSSSVQFSPGRPHMLLPRAAGFEVCLLMVEVLLV